MTSTTPPDKVDLPVVELHSTEEQGLPPSSSLLFTPDLSEPQSPSRSPSQRSPRRIETDPKAKHSDKALKLVSFKRIVVCCDGTWQDGLSAKQSKYTNVLRLSRAINHLDERYDPPIPQIVYYQSGVGTNDNLYSKYIEGATGWSIVEKVEEAYAFIAHNYCPGDEIFLFGFSRGAYTARMIAMLIGEIGVLDRRDMDHFATIFMNYQLLVKTNKEEEQERLTEELKPWRDRDSNGRRRADPDGDEFTVKCIGVWDTVGAYGLPEELTPLSRSRSSSKILSFHDRFLGPHVERGYQALALHEMRSDFMCTKFEQTPLGRERKQILKQCWFAGSHTDVGGGYKDRDLSDISLTWLTAHISDILSIDPQYIKRTISPVAQWGTQEPHDSMKGIFNLGWKAERALPSGPNDPVEHEMIHPSVLRQRDLPQDLRALVKNHPDIVARLLPLEEEVKAYWPFDPSSDRVRKYNEWLLAEGIVKRPKEKIDSETKGWSLASRLFRSFSSRSRRTIMASASEDAVRPTEDKKGRRPTLPAQRRLTTNS